MKKIINGIHSIIKTFVLSAAIISQVHFAYAQTASVLPPAQTTFFDANGNPLTSGTVEFFVPGQSGDASHKTTWKDSAETIPNTNPVHLDGAGRAIIWGDGAYRQVVKDSNHNLIWDAVTSSPGGSSGGGGTIGDSNSVGAIVPWSGFTVPPQYLYAAGQAISRTGFPLLYSIVTLKQSVVCAGGNATLTSIADTSQLNINSPVEAICVPSGAFIISKTASSVTLSATATISTTTTAIFYPYGNGDGANTFNVPDYRGVVLPGRNNMNGVSGTFISSPNFFDPNSLYGFGGGQTSILTTLNLPPYTPAGVIDNSTVPVTGNTLINGNSDPSHLAVSNNANAPIGTVSIISSGAFHGTPQGGTSTPFRTLMPSRTVNYIIKALPNPAITAAQCINLIDAGTACEVNTGTSGHTVPFLDGSNVFSSDNTFTSGITINGTAAALVGNKNSSTGSDVDFTIQGLTLKGTIDANNDFMLLWDNVANAFKKVTPGQIGSTGVSGVSSLGGQTGAVSCGTGINCAASTISVIASISAITGANTTYTSAQAYTIVNRSNGGLPMSDTLPGTSPGILPLGTRLTVTNTDTAGILSIKVGAGSAFLTGISASNGFVYVCPGQSFTFYSDHVNYSVIDKPDRCKFSADANIFIATTGLSINDGLTVSMPMLDPTSTYNVARDNFNINSNNINFIAAVGTYPQVTLDGPIVGSVITRNTNNVFFTGVPANPSSVKIADTGSTGFAAIQVLGGAAVTLNGFQVTSVNNSGLIGDLNSSVVYQNIDWHGVRSGLNHVIAEYGGRITLAGNETISSGAGCHWISGNGGQIETTGAITPVTTITGTPVWVSGYACTQYSGSNIVVQGPYTITGTATGPKVNVTGGSTVNSGALGGCGNFPGSTAGSVASSGTCQ